MMKMIDRANTTTLHTLPIPIAVPSCKPSSAESSVVEEYAGEAELTVTLDIAVKSAVCIADVADLGVVVTVDVVV